MKLSPQFWFVIGLVAIGLLAYAAYVQRGADRIDAEYQRDLQGGP